MTGDRHIGWASVQPGDHLRLRHKRRGDVPRVEVTVVEVLARELANGRGIIADDGQPYREFFWDLELVDD